MYLGGDTTSSGGFPFVSAATWPHKDHKRGVWVQPTTRNPMPPRKRDANGKPVKPKDGWQEKDWLWTLDVEPIAVDGSRNPDGGLTGKQVAERLMATQQVKYVLVGEETGTQNGRAHLQGMLMLHERKKLGGVIELFGTQRVHIGGDWDEHGVLVRNAPIFDLAGAIKYCQKQGKCVEYGTPPQIGDARAPIAKAWDEARDLCMAGKAEEVFLKHSGFIRYRSSIMAFAAKYSRPANRPRLDNWWIYGTAGTGKTSTVMDREGQSLFVTGTVGRFAFNDYDPTECNSILFDDIRTEELNGNLRFMKLVLDHYPFRAETKGGSLGLIRPARVYITSKHHLRDVVPADHYDEFARRLKIMTAAEFKAMVEGEGAKAKVEEVVDLT